MVHINPERAKFTAFHKTLTDGSNQPIGFYRLLDETCPQCSKGRLGVMQESPQSQTVHCEWCDYQLTRRPPAGRLKPMNSGG